MAQDKTTDPQVPEDPLTEALARFKQASSSSYLVVEWEIDTKVPQTCTLAYSKSLNAKKSKTKGPAAPTTTPPTSHMIKAKHTLAAEGTLFALNVQALDRWLIPGSHYLILLRAGNDVVLLQQFGGASVGAKRVKALAAARSLLEMVPYVSVTINLTRLDDLNQGLLRFNAGSSPSSNLTLARSSSVKSLPGKVSRRVPRYNLVDEAPSPPLRTNISPTGSSWTSGKSSLLDHKRLSAVSTADTVFHDCEGSIDDEVHISRKNEAEQRPQQVVSPAFDKAHKKEASLERKLAPLPAIPQPEPFAALHRSIDAWLSGSDPSVTSDSRKEPTIIDYSRKRSGEQAINQPQAVKSQKDEVVRVPTEERRTWQSNDIPSYYGKSDDTTVKELKTALAQQKGAKIAAAPLSAPSTAALLPLDLHPAKKSELSRTPSLRPLVLALPRKYANQPDTGHRDITKEEGPRVSTEGHTQSRLRSRSVARRVSPKTPSKATEESINMPPYLSSPQEARKKAIDLQQDGFEGESWINKRQRERSASDAQVLAVNKGWSVIEPKIPTSSPGPAEIVPQAVPSNTSGTPQTRHQDLCLQLSKLQKAMSQLDAVERLHRIKWAGEKSHRQGLEAFERSQRESNERHRRQEFEDKRNEIRLQFGQIDKEQKHVKSLIEEGLTYKGKVEQAKRQRSIRMQFAEQERQKKQQQEQVRLKVKAERRADLRVELQTTASPILARGLITVQSDDGLRRRRRFELHRDALLFFSETMSARTNSYGGSGDNPLAKVIIEPGSVILIRDDAEASQASHSFLIQYHDIEKTTVAELMAYADTEGEKERLLIGLSILSCYKLKDDVFES